MAGYDKGFAYNMRGARKGLMLCAMTAEEGGESDMEIMNRFFRKFRFGGYGSNIIPNASAVQMRENILRFRNNLTRDSQPISCILVSVSCHGSEDELQGADHRRIKLSEIIQPFSDENCPRLKGIPKIFIVDACRGVEDKGVHRQAPQNRDFDMRVIRSRTNYAPPVIDDMYSIYPATLGYTTMGTRGGGFLHQSIRDVFLNDWRNSREESLDDLLYQVKQNFQARNTVSSDSVVSAVVDSTLRKRIYL